MPIIILEKPISKEELEKIGKEYYEFVIKLAVDIEKQKICAGGKWHAECQEFLMRNGSNAKDIWGCNFHLQKPKGNLEFWALINIRPNFGHFTMEIKDEKIKNKITEIVNKFIQ